MTHNLLTGVQEIFCEFVFQPTFLCPKTSFPGRANERFKLMKLFSTGQWYLDRLTPPHVLDLWCCGVGRKRCQGQCQSTHHLVDNPFGVGIRIGEAKNPGPETSFTISLVNPTSILTKSQDIAELHSDVVALSETSATSNVQHQFRQAMKSLGHASLFSGPVDSQKQRTDGLTSDRGLAAGTALVARVPMRKYHPVRSITDHLDTRIQTAMVQLGATSILTVVIYGFQQNLPQAKQKTNQLLTEAVEILFDHKGPSMILGDFNHDPDDIAVLGQHPRKTFVSVDAFIA